MMDGETEQQRPAVISVIDPISRAIDWARDVLFRPFSFEKWIVLGFCAWLSRLGEGGGGGGSSSGWTPDDSRDVGRGLREGWEWLVANLLPVLLIAGTVILIVVAFWLLFLWLSSRGKFMFLDGVVNNRAAVVEPWHRFRVPANGVFLLRVVVGLVGLAAVLLFLAFLVSLGVAAYGSREIEPVWIAALVLSVMTMLGVGIVLALVELAINDFMVPLMYLRQSGVGEAWRELQDLVSARPGAFVLYVLVRILIAIVLGILSVLVCCLTCCVAALPFIGTVILLPLLVFRRAYSLYFLGQFGPAYSRFAELGPVAES